MKKRADGRYLKQITINGKVKSFYGKTQAEVNKKILEYQGEQKNGRVFSAVADEWWGIHQEKIEHNTAKQYRPALREIINFFGDMMMQNIESAQVEKFIYSFAAQGYAKKTVKTRLLVLNLIFKYAVVHGYSTSNPCLYIEVPRNLKTQKRAFPTKEELDIVKKSTSCTFGIFAYFVLFTGLRRAEALCLTVSDIDFETNEIHVNKSIYWMGNVPHLKTPKTEAGIRSVILLDCLASELKNYIQANKLGGKDLLFPGQNGELMHNGHFTRLWDKYREETGLTITPHQLRHAYATILYEAGVDLKDAQTLMGHSSIQVTQDIYTHISETQKKKTASKLNAFVNQ